MTISRWILLGIGNVSDNNRRENQNAHFMFSNLFLKIVPPMRKCWKCGKAIEAADNIAPASSVLDKHGYTRASTRPSTCAHIHTHTRRYARTRIVTHMRAHHTHTHTLTHREITTSTVVSWTQLNVTLCIYRLSFFVFLQKHELKWNFYLCFIRV